MSRENNLKTVMSIIYIFFTVLFIINLNSMNLIPNKYILLVVIILAILNLIAIVCMILKKKLFRVVTVLIYLLLSIGYIVGIMYISRTNDFIDSTFEDNEIKSVTVNYLLLSKKEYSDKDLYNKTVFYDREDESIDIAISELNKDIMVSMKEIDDFSNIYNKDIFFISEINYDELQENYGINPNDYHVLKKVELVFDVEVEDVVVKKDEPYNVYLAAKDFSGYRIDLNKIITVNPQTKEVIITSVNRFSYLEIEGKGKNRLSSTGYYGVSDNKKAIENALNITIDYYFAVETNGFVEFVDALGGIEYCSDVSYMTTHALVLGTYDDTKGKKLYVKKGCQHLNGIEALTVARERNNFKGYITQRERNATAIMEDILEAAKKPSNITRYLDILDAMEGLYKTNIPKDTIKYAIKSLLNDKWDIYKQELEGKYGTNDIRYGKERGYVYYLDSNSVKKISDKINELYNKTK